MMRYIFFLLAGLVAVGCRREREQVYERVLIVYLAGDNDLSGEITRKLSMIESGFKNQGSEDSKVICYVDTRDEAPVLVDVTLSGRQVIRTYPRQNSASTEVLRDVIGYIKDCYKARKYGMQVFSHATGWLPRGALSDPYMNADLSRSIMLDGSAEMELEDFAAAIPNGAFDYIVFEACYMAGIEVAYALRSKTEYIVASSAEIVSPGFEEIYPYSTRHLLGEKPALHEFADAYFQNWDANTSTLRSATISLISTRDIESLADAVREALKGKDLTRVDVTPIQHFNRSAHHLVFDLTDFIEHVANKVQLENYRAVLEHVVLYQAATPRFLSGLDYSFPIRAHSGLTVYIPQDEFPLLNARYNELSWCKRINTNRDVITVSTGSAL